MGIMLSDQEALLETQFAVLKYQLKIKDIKENIENHWTLIASN